MWALKTWPGSLCSRCPSPGPRSDFTPELAPQGLAGQGEEWSEVRKNYHAPQQASFSCVILDSSSNIFCFCTSREHARSKHGTLAEYLRVDWGTGGNKRWGRIRRGGIQRHLRKSDLAVVGYRKTASFRTEVGAWGKQIVFKEGSLETGGNWKERKLLVRALQSLKLWRVRSQVMGKNGKERRTALKN